ncbi:MAG: c-type cytochrome [Luteimonas sp.]
MTRPLSIAACLALAALSFAGMAQDAPTGNSSSEQAAPAQAVPAAAAAATGDADRGRSLTYTCQGCHGIAGYKNAYPNYHVPKIGGQSTVYLINALTEYRKGTRKHPTMQAQAQSFSDQDIADIATFLSGLTP